MAKLGVSLEPTHQTRTKIKPVLVTSTKLDTLLEDYVVAAAKASQFEAKKKQLAPEINKIVKAKSGLPQKGKIETADFLVTDVCGANHYVDPVLLAKAGISAKVIRSCTRSTPFSYPLVTRKRAPDVELMDVVRKAEGNGKRGRR